MNDDLLNFVTRKAQDSLVNYRKFILGQFYENRLNCSKVRLKPDM